MAIKNSCNCDICVRSRFFDKHLETVMDEKAKEFFIHIFDLLYETEEELDCYKIYFNNVKHLNKEVWQSSFTLKQPIKN